MAGPHLIYFADPMCSWCWGFAPVIGAIRQRFGDALPIRLMMGGLCDCPTYPLTRRPALLSVSDESRSQLRGTGVTGGTRRAIPCSMGYGQVGPGVTDKQVPPTVVTPCLPLGPTLKVHFPLWSHRSPLSHLGKELE